MKLGFSTKAGTLTALSGKVASARIAPARTFTVADWKLSRAGCLADLKDSLKTEWWIVRSSCHREDGKHLSNAGAFLSIGDVGSAGVEDAVERVIASYGHAQPSDEVLIQPMLTKVVRS